MDDVLEQMSKVLVLEPKVLENVGEGGEDRESLFSTMRRKVFSKVEALIKHLCKF